MRNGNVNRKGSVHMHTNLVRVFSYSISKKRLFYRSLESMKKKKNTISKAKVNKTLWGVHSCPIFFDICILFLRPYFPSICICVRLGRYMASLWMQEEACYTSLLGLMLHIDSQTNSTHKLPITNYFPSFSRPQQAENHSECPQF